MYTVPPPQPKEKKPGQLDKCQLEQYFDKGFVVIPKFFTDEEMEPAIKVRAANQIQWGGGGGVLWYSTIGASHLG